MQKTNDQVQHKERSSKPKLSDEEIISNMADAIRIDGDRGLGNMNPESPLRLASRIFAAIRAYEEAKGE